MALLIWTGFFIIDALFWCWVIFWGGAERLQETWIADVLICYGAHNCDADGIKLLAWVILIGTAIWYIIGLFVPELRLI